MASTQKIKLLVVNFVNSLLAGKPTMSKLAMQTPVVVTYEKFVENLVKEHNLPKTQVKAVLGSVAESAGDYMALGNAVQIHPDLGTLKPRITVKAQANEKDVSVKDVTGIGIRFIPTGLMRTLLSSTQYQITGKGSADDGESDIVDPSNPEGGDDNGGESGGGDNGGGSPDPEPETYTMTFHFNDGTEDTAQLAEGATITYPANTSGYKWPDNKRSTMPASAYEVTEVKIDEEDDSGF